MNVINSQSIIEALNYIAEDHRNMKSFKFDDFIHIYQRPVIKPNNDILVNGYAKWCFKQYFFISCFGINIPLFDIWADDAKFDETHAELILKHIDDIKEKLRIYFL